MNETRYKASGTTSSTGTTAMSSHNRFVVASNSIEASAGSRIQPSTSPPDGGGTSSSGFGSTNVSLLGAVGSMGVAGTLNRRLTCQPRKPASKAKSTNTPLHIQPCIETL